MISSKAISRQSSVKDVSLATDMEALFNQFFFQILECPKIHEMQVEKVIIREPFLAGIIEKDLRDSSRPNQPIEQDRNIVVVKGHLLAIRSPLHHHLITMRKPHCCLLKRYIICISSSLRLSLSTCPSMFSLLAMEGQRHVNGNLGGS